MRLPDGTSLFRKGLVPTIPAASNPDAKHRTFAAEPTEGVKKFIHSPERPRHNEQALVAGTAPELPFQLAESSGKPTEFDKPPFHHPRAPTGRRCARNRSLPWVVLETANERE